MLSCQCRLVLTAAFFLASPTDAFRFQTNVARHRQPLRRTTPLYHQPRPNQRDRSHDYRVTRSNEEGRRIFLKRLSAAIAGTVLMPPLSFADEDDVKMPSDEDGTKTSIEKDDVKTSIEELDKDIILSIDEDDTKTSIKKLDEDDIKTPTDEDGIKTSIKQLDEDGIKTPIDEDDIKKSIDKLETLIEDEIELDAEILQDETDEKKSIEDEKQLIGELEKRIAIEESDASTSEEIAEEADIIKGETESLIKEEEQLKSETEEMITKIEAMESEVKALDQEDGIETGNDATKEKESEVFVDKLKGRVEQKEDLITRLKRQSENDIDPKTGKFRAMTAKEYKERAKSTDTDFIQFLKDTVANEQEWERDLEAFEGFLNKEFGPTVKELSKDLKPLVGEVEREFQKEVAPAVGDVLQQLKEKAGPAAESEVEDLKQRAEGLIGKLRSIF